jgi:hypothetical protein
VIDAIDREVVRSVAKMDESHRNQEIAELIEIWEWCSSSLHVTWQRKRKNRNSCLLALAYAISQPNFVSPLKLTRIYKTLPTPLLDKDKVETFWNVQPVPLLELCLSSFTKRSPLKAKLDRIRAREQTNRTLDGIVKKMRSREKRFGSDWCFQGHHPENEFIALRNEIAPLREKIKNLVLEEYAAIESLAQEVLAQGPWRFGELPASSLVRKTPESLLNRASRLKLWQAAQEVLVQDLDDEATLEALCNVLLTKLTPSLKAAIKSQGYTSDQVIDDIINFDIHKSRDQITR